MQVVFTYFIFHWPFLAALKPPSWDPVQLLRLLMGFGLLLIPWKVSIILWSSLEPSVNLHKHGHFNIFHFPRNSPYYPKEMGTETSFPFLFLKHYIKHFRNHLKNSIKTLSEPIWKPPWGCPKNPKPFWVYRNLQNIMASLHSLQ